MRCSVTYPKKSRVKVRATRHLVSTVLSLFATLTASLFPMNVSAAPLDLRCDFKSSGYPTNLILSINDTSSSSRGSVELASGKVIEGGVEVSSRRYRFEGGDSEISVGVSVSRDDGSATIRTTVGDTDFVAKDAECSKYSGTKF